MMESPLKRVGRILIQLLIIGGLFLAFILMCIAAFGSFIGESMLRKML